METLVTGASGFVGRHVAEALRDAGSSVRCLVRGEADAASLAREGFAVVRGDLSDARRLAEAVRGCGAVVHVAGMISARSFEEMRGVNEGGTGRLAAACGLAGTPPSRFVLVSSLAAAGPSSGGRAVREDDAPRPVSRYGWSKLLGERAARRALPRATSLVVLRPPAVFGPRDRGILPFFRAASRGVRPRIGLRPRSVSLVFGPDLADAVRRAVEAPQAAGRTYHVADPDARTLDETLLAIAGAVGMRTVEVSVPEALLRAVGVLAEETARLAGRVPEFSRDKAAEFLAPGWVCDPTRARNELGWAPRLGFAEALAATAAWYRTAGWLR
jgi:nucleoside-diphosphate-sugar epimerase